MQEIKTNFWERHERMRVRLEAERLIAWKSDFS